MSQAIVAATFPASLLEQFDREVAKYPPEQKQSAVMACLITSSRWVVTSLMFAQICRVFCEMVRAHCSICSASSASLRVKRLQMGCLPFKPVNVWVLVPMRQ